MQGAEHAGLRVDAAVLKQRAETAQTAAAAARLCAQPAALSAVSPARCPEASRPAVFRPAPPVPVLPCACRPYGIGAGAHHRRRPAACLNGRFWPPLQRRNLVPSPLAPGAHSRARESLAASRLARNPERYCDTRPWRVPAPTAAWGVCRAGGNVPGCVPARVHPLPPPRTPRHQPISSPPHAFPGARVGLQIARTLISPGVARLAGQCQRVSARCHARRTPAAPACGTACWRQRASSCVRGCTG